MKVNGQVVWKGTQALGFAPPKSFKALVPSGQTITYAARVIDSRGQKATSNLYFTARVGQGMRHTMLFHESTLVHKCHTFKDDSIYIINYIAFSSTDTHTSYRKFTLLFHHTTGLPCSPTDVQPNVDASACNGVKAGATCTLSCTSGYVSTGNPATYTCDPENPDMDVGAFSCRKTCVSSICYVS